MAEEFDQLAIHPLSRTVCRHSRIRLGGGWAGSVLTACAGGELGGDADDDWPTMSQWTEWLRRLVQSPGLLPGYEVLKQSGKGEVIRVRIELSDRRIDVVCKREAFLHKLRNAGNLQNHAIIQRCVFDVDVF